MPSMKHNYLTFGKVIFTFFVLTGIVVLTLPILQKSLRRGKSGTLLIRKERDVVLENEPREEVSVVQTRCHPGI